MKNVYERSVFVLAPVVWVIGWVIMRLGGSRGPGIGWKTAHVTWIVAFGLFAVVAVLLWRAATRDRPGGWSMTGALGLALTGAALMIGQMCVDLWASFGAADKAELIARSRQAADVPGVELMLFIIAPALLYLGLIALLTILAVQRQVTAWSPILVVASVALSMAGRSIDGLRILEGIGALGLLAALLPFARRAEVGRAAGGEAGAGRRQSLSQQ
jgi:hypothetical protein